MAVWSPHVAIVAVATLTVTALVLRAIRAGTAGLRAPTIAYGIVISAMVIAASATLGGPLAAAPLAAGGATFFYASDASLALNRFRRPIPHAAVLHARPLLDRADRDRARRPRRSLSAPRQLERRLQLGRTAPGSTRPMIASQIRKKLIRSRTGFIQPTVMQ